MKITVIGANSNIARNFIYINSDSHEMYLYDYQDKHMDNYKNYISVNLSNPNDINKIELNVDLIYFFVGLTGSLADTSKTYDSVKINEIYLINVLDRLVKMNFQGKIIFPSTRLVYKGKNEPLNEESEKEFKSAYAISKYAGENYLKLYNLIHGINYVVLRICIPYGSLIKNSKSYGTIELFLSKAKNKENITIYGTGEQIRTFTSMTDLCNILMLCGENENVKNDVYNVGGQCLSLYDVASIIASKYFVKVENIAWPEISYKLESGSTMFNSLKLDNIINYHYLCTFQEWING